MISVLTLTLISNYVKKLVSLNNVKSVHDIKGLRKLFQNAEFSMENSQTLKVNL